MNKIYNTPATPETAVIRAQYQPSKTPHPPISLSIKALSSISLTPSSGDMSISSTYNLSSLVAVTANYSDLSIADLTQDASTVWTMTSVPGTLNGKIYNSTAAKESAVFQVAYTVAGITKTASFTVNVIDTTAPEISMPQQPAKPNT